MQRKIGDSIIAVYSAENIEIDGKRISFNGDNLVDENAEKTGTFFGEDYGKESFLTNPAEVFAYLLIMENKALLKDERRSEIYKDKLLGRINRFIDFPSIFTKEEFHDVVRKIFLQKNANPHHFFDELEENMDLSNKGESNHEIIKNAFIMRLKNIIKIYNLTKPEDIISQISNLETPPKGYSKTSLITNAMDIFNAQENLLLKNFPELFEGFRFMPYDWDWADKLIKEINEGKIRNNAKAIIDNNEAIDICQHMKAIQISLNDLIELLTYNSHKVLKKEAEPEFPTNYFNVDSSEFFLE
ncbi:MAG: hypothetical protein EOM55_03050 [Clostridia bacterium]|nr:hypothetical protein [Clostridia bacterium]